MKTRPLNHITSDYRKLTDEDVIHRYAHRHEHSAFTCLYDRYSHIVLGLCIKYLSNVESAKDATQQIFIKLLEDLKRFEIANFKPWLLQVTRNHCLMQLRKTLTVVNNTIELGEDVDFEEELHPDIERDQLVACLEKAMETLSGDQHTCITLFYLKKQTYSSIAEQTGFTIMQVKSFIQNGKRNLRNKILTLYPAKAAKS